MIKINGFDPSRVPRNVMKSVISHVPEVETRVLPKTVARPAEAKTRRLSCCGSSDCSCHPC